MARRLTILTSLLMVIAFVALATGCGVKNPPVPSSQLAPPAATDLKAMPRVDGMLVSFNLPDAITPARAVDEVYLFYGYLPLTGDPVCPPCPPKLRKYHKFDMAKKGETEAQKMKGGSFKYLDKNAPRNKEAVYQVMLVDASGRKGPRSPFLRMPRLMGVAAPTGLKAEAGDSVVSLAWQEVTTLSNGQKATDMSGYIVFRKGPAGQKQLNARPLTKPMLVDRTVVNGKKYAYQVHAVRKFHDRNLPGAGSGWVVAKPKDMKAPGAPLDLAGASTSDGIYLRFTPSTDADTVGYNIFRKQKGGKWVKINDALVTENVFIDKGLKNEVQYYYKVQAVDKTGNISGFSEVMDIVHLP